MVRRTSSPSMHHPAVHAKSSQEPFAFSIRFLFLQTGRINGNLCIFSANGFITCRRHGRASCTRCGTPCVTTCRPSFLTRRTEIQGAKCVTSIHPLCSSSHIQALLVDWNQWPSKLITPQVRTGRFRNALTENSGSLTLYPFLTLWGSTATAFLLFTRSPLNKKGVFARMPKRPDN